MSKAKLAIALSTLSVVLVAWAVPIAGIAHQRFQRLRGADVVAPVRLKDERGGRFLTEEWLLCCAP